MAMYATLSQPKVAMYGQPCAFIVAITNSGGSPVTMDSLSLVVTLDDDVPATSANVAQYSPPVGSSDSVSAGGTIYRSISASFFGQALNGAGGEGTNWFKVAALLSFGDDTVFQTSWHPVGLAGPVWGQPGGSPSVVPLNVPSMQLVSAQNSQYVPFFL